MGERRLVLLLTFDLRNYINWHKIKEMKKKIEKDKMADTIKTTFDLRTCFVNMQNDEGVVILDKTQWEEICKLVET